MKVLIIDYGMGNVKSISAALSHLGVDSVSVSNKKKEIESADKLILPGVGSFSTAMKNIKEFRLDFCLKNEILDKKKPVLGICLGMQLMTKSSIEGGLTSGLDFIDAKVEKFPDINIKTPHIGFNQVKKSKNSKLFSKINDFSDFYFVHGHYVVGEGINQSVCEYGNNFIASYEVENIAGVQSHPELSQINGLKLIANFLNNF